MSGNKKPITVTQSPAVRISTIKLEPFSYIMKIESICICVFLRRKLNLVETQMSLKTKACFIHKTDSLKVNNCILNSLQKNNDSLMKNAPKHDICQTLVKHQSPQST